MQILEAFRALNALNEDVFDLDDNGLQGLSDFKQNDDLEDDISIIDPEAENEDDLQDNYIGKVILDCCTCHSKLYKAKEEVTVDESGELANVGEECPYCFTPDGFKVIGEVTEFDATEENSGSEEEEAPVNELLDANVTLDARGFGGTGNAVSVLGGKLPESLSTKNGASDGASSWDKMVNKASKKPASKDGYKSSRTVISDPEYRKNLNMKLGLPPKAFEEDITSDGDSVNEGIFGFGKKKKLAAEKARKEAEEKRRQEEEDEERRERIRQQNVIDSHMRYDKSKRDAEREYARNRYNSIQADRPSNTGHRGVNYSGGDYYSEAVAPDEFKMKPTKTGGVPYRYADETAPEEDTRKLRAASDKRGNMKESIDDLSMTANDTHLEVSEDEGGRVTVTMEPVTADGGETISPVSPETEMDIMGGEEGIPAEDVSENEVDVDLEEVDEESMDELGESYFRRVYENVNSYKTTAVRTRGNQMIVEGNIKFNSGKVKKTSFVFEAKDATRGGKVRFTGDNKQLTEGKKAFTLTGRVNNKKLVLESMSYNYGHRDNNGGISRVRGSSRVKSKRV